MEFEKPVSEAPSELALSVPDVEPSSEQAEEPAEHASPSQPDEVNPIKGVNMSTQLALAETYLAMEDWESARASLQDVVSGGTQEQVEKAEKLLARIEGK